MTPTQIDTWHKPLPSQLAESSRIGAEISITGKWVPKTAGGLFRKSPDSTEMLQEWEDIHAGARTDPGILATEINHAVGADAVLVHHIFRDADAVRHYFSTTATKHMQALLRVAKPEHHLVRGITVPAAVREAISAKSVPASFGDYLYGYVKDNYRLPDPKTAIQVTAKWTCAENDPERLDGLKYWWQQVAAEAHQIEKGLSRFEVFQVHGENAAITHETFDNTSELQFHLAKGTAHKYKKHLDKIAAPECYFFRGPVAWTIRTYSKFLHLPATYSNLGSNFITPGGSMSAGRTD
ncbi:MAG: hypothetical protein HQ479_00750 [Rhodobacter sp.]|nr:hypothetical protein [Rhodobacter sp.]